MIPQGPFQLCRSKTMTVMLIQVSCVINIRKFCFVSSLYVGLLQIELKSRKTCFWRHQKGKPDTYLSTIEAIYYFLVDYHKEVLKEKYDGQYDNLLFFFAFMYRLIKTAKSSVGKE